MKETDLEMQKLTMDDSDYDEYEEEVIDRDEEYEVDDDEEEYDDEEYDDEDYDDEEYDDEEEDYDDGYDDNYYDERLNKVLDELAELKRSMANPPAVQSPAAPYVFPQQPVPYVINGGMPVASANSGNDVLMYNEISRLRDELSKTQNSQNLHVELNRLKDEMERDRKYNESQYLGEIKRLNEKIETLQKNSLGPQSEDEAYLPEPASGGNSVDNESFNKLISINESILQSAHTSDTHFDSELADIKKRLAVLDSEEFSKALSAVRKLGKSGISNLSLEDMNSLSGEIAALKTALGNIENLPAAEPGANQASGSADAHISAEIAELKEIASDSGSDSIVLLKKLGELNRAIGYYSEEERDSKESALALMDEFIALKGRAESTSFGDLLYAFNDFTKKVSTLGTSDAVALANACDIFGNEILRTSLDKRGIEDLIRFSDDTAVFSVNREKRDALDKFSVLSQRLLKCEVGEVAEVVPQLLEAKSKLQSKARQDFDDALSKEIVTLAASGVSDSKLKDGISTLCNLRACDFVRFPRITVEIKVAEEKTIESMLVKADRILEALANSAAVEEETSFDAAETAEAVEETATETASDADLAAIKEEIINLCTAKQLDDALSELKNQYIKIVNALTALPEGAVSAETASAVSAMADEAQFNNNELSDQMYNIRDELSKAIHDENQITQDTVELKLADISQAQKQAAEDLEFIRNKLNETRELIENVSSMRDKVESETQKEASDDDNKLYDDICEQFDKLYEDVSSLITTNENNVVDRLSESVNSTMETVNAIIDSINGNIDSINSLVSGVNTSLEGVNSNFDITNNNINNINNTFGDNFANITLILDEVREHLASGNYADLKPVIDDLVARVTADNEAALNDRLRLVDDVSFLRQQAENGDSNQNQAVYDELIQMRENVTRELNVLADTLSGLNIDEMRENVSMIKDTVDILASDTTIGMVGEDILELKESNRVLNETVERNAAAQEEFVSAMKDDLAYIRSKFDEKETDESAVTVGDVYDVLVSVNEKLDTVSADESQDVQNVLNVLEEIKEQLHLKELEPSIEGVTGSEAEKQTLLNEIAEVRERLAGLEGVSREQSDATFVQLGLINDELTVLKDSLSANESAAGEGVEAMLNDIAERIDILSQNASDISQLPTVMADIAEIKNALIENTAVAESDGLADIMQTVNDMSDRVKDFAERMELASLEIDSIPLVLSELGEVKESLAEIRSRLSAFEGIESVPVESSDKSDIASRLDKLNDKTNELIERSESGVGVISDESLREVTGEIAEIRENLFSDYEKIKEDISFIRNQIELNVEEADDTSLDLSEGEDLSSVLEELAEIKEKLAASDEYDIMAEILSLREDLKISRLTEPSEVGDELELVKSDMDEKNDLLLEEIRGLRSELSALPAEKGELTGDELNMVLNEIVSLRDEIQSYKDEIGARTTVSENAETVVERPVSEESENFAAVIDELSDMRSALADFKEETRENRAEEIEPIKDSIESLRDGLDEIKDMISRRTTLNTEVGDSGEESFSTGSELDVVLNELINLKQEFESVRSQLSDEIQAVGAVNTESNDVESAEGRGYDEILDAIEQLKDSRIIGDGDDGTLNILSEMLLLHSELNDIRSLIDSGKVAKPEYSESDVPASDYSEVLSQLAEIKEQLADRPVRAESSEGISDDSDMKAELAEIKQLLMRQASVERDDEIEMLRDEIVGLREELAGMSGNVENVTEDVGMSAEIMSLKDEIASLKEQLLARPVVESEPDMSVMTEIMSLREEIASLREQMGQPVAQAQSAEPDMTVLTEVMALREEIGELKGSLATPDSDIVETVAQIREDVRVMKDEPDLSALNEVLALRDEFQAMKDEIANRNNSDEVTKSDEEILSEVQSLRDQLFAISMANVNDGSSDKVTYESYNNIILDEITALREELNAYKANDAVNAVMDEIAEIKRSIAAQTADESELMTQLSKLKSDLEALKNNDAKDATNNAILAELANLKTELTNQREADLTTLNFMSEMAHLIERQNQYINQSANSKITDEIESLKAEIASSLAAPSAETSAIMSEILKLKEELSQDSGRNIDNQTILDELAKLKDEISVEKPSKQNELVLEEIARLKNELSTLSDKNGGDSKDVSVEEISQTINDLKNELTQIADIVGEEEKPKKAPARRQTSKSSAGSKKSTAKKGGRSKSTTAKSTSTRSTSSKKSTAKKVVKETLSSDELLSKIDAVSLDIPHSEPSNDDEVVLSLDPNYIPAPSTRDELDIASKLAKQVANKLIMEELVEQLGDGGVPENEVEEIVKDILPQEFSTIMIEEQSDQVRRLANSLVLDKLRARLKGRKDDE